MKGFYKLTESPDGKYQKGAFFYDILYAEKTVDCKEYHIDIKEKDTYIFPVDGWYYFETRQTAIDFFGLTEVIEKYM